MEREEALIFSIKGSSGKEKYLPSGQIIEAKRQISVLIFMELLESCLYVNY